MSLGKTTPKDFSPAQSRAQRISAQLILDSKMFSNCLDESTSGNGGVKTGNADRFGHLVVNRRLRRG